MSEQPAAKRAEAASVACPDAAAPATAPGQDAPATGKSTWAAKHVGWIWAACVVVVLALVAAFGGFRARTDQRIDLAPGTPVALGVAEVSVISATARYSYGAWDIDLRVDLTNTTDQPITSDSLSGAIQISYLNDAGVEQASGGGLGVLGGPDGTEPTLRRVIPPGSGVVPVVLSISIFDGFRSDQGIRVGLYPVAFRTNTILGLSDDKQWVMDKLAADYHYWRVIPPLDILET